MPFILTASCSTCRDASNELSFDIKRSPWKFDRRSRSWCISVDPYRRPEHICDILIVLACLYQKLLAKNCWWPFKTWNELGDIRRGNSFHNIPTQGVNSNCNSMFESVSNSFISKEALFNFLPLTYNGEVAKLTWSWVTDIKITRHTFYRYC